MSPRTRIITLNLGSQSIELAVFHARTHGELTLINYRSRDLLAGPGEENGRQEEIIAAVREMQRELQIKGGPVNYTVAEELIFTRFIELPPVGDDSLGQIIPFEAEQKIPFPIDEVVWDYQKVGIGVTDQTQVILAAIKTDLIEQINAAIEATGLRTSIVDLATMSLCNAFHRNYDDATGCSLLIDIGARTTNLLFIEADKIFTRSVPIGGSSVTAAIAREFNESFAAAEARKKRAGFVKPGLTVTDAATCRVSEIMCSTLTRLHLELQRSINHYQSQQQGGAPVRAFLSGGGASPSSIREFFEEKLRLPTEFFDPLRKVTVAESADRDQIVQSAHLLGEPVGLALRAGLDCRMTLNLCPRSVRLRRETERRRRFLVGAAICVMIGLLGMAVQYTASAHALSCNTEMIEQQVVALQSAESELNQVRTEVAALDRVAGPLVAAINDRSFWPQVLDELNARLPEANIWVTELTATSGGGTLDTPKANKARPDSTGTTPEMDGLLLRGLYLFNPKQQEIVVDYFRNLAGSPLFAIDPKNQAKGIKPTTPNDTEWAFPYELRLELRKPTNPK